MKRLSRKFLILMGVLLLAVFLLIFTLVTPGWKPVVVSVYEGPQLMVENRIQDIGAVETDRKVRTEFLLYNTGGRHLRLYRVDASCGCTVADISRKILAPGDFSRIRVVMDTSLKLGNIRKKLTLFSNDPQRPVLDLFIVGRAVAGKVAGHADITLKAHDRLALFKGDCATCHVQKGIGKTGQALFQADCAMCHGQHAEGNRPSGPPLLGNDPENEAWLAHIHNRIAAGSPNSPQMPPFAKAKGGPLTPDEVDSLVSFLKFRTMQKKAGLPAALANDVDESPEDLATFKEAARSPH